MCCSVQCSIVISFDCSVTEMRLCLCLWHFLLTQIWECILVLIEKKKILKIRSLNIEKIVLCIYIYIYVINWLEWIKYRIYLHLTPRWAPIRETIEWHHLFIIKIIYSKLLLLRTTHSFPRSWTESQRIFSILWIGIWIRSFSNSPWHN